MRARNGALLARDSRYEGEPFRILLLSKGEETRDSGLRSRAHWLTLILLPATPARSHHKPLSFQYVSRYTPDTPPSARGSRVARRAIYFTQLF